MELIISLAVVICGLVFGSILEKKHYKSIKQREDQYKNIVVLSDKDLKDIEEVQNNNLLLTWGTAVSIDAFKKFMAWFVHFFWWRIKSYESLVDRARREAILRLKQEAYEKWYNAIANLRIETSSITKNAKQSVWSVEAFAYATGVHIENLWK